MPNAIAELLTAFASKLDVPAIVGGCINANGDTSIEVIGTTKRRGNIQATLDDAWHIGSCAKSITAALCARFVERGRWQWSTPIAELFPDLHAEMDTGWHHRTLDELLYCIAGVKPNPTIKQMRKGWQDDRSLVEQRTELATGVLRTPPKRPGKFAYSNLGYVVLGAAIDRTEYSTYEHALHAEVLEPLKINSLGYGPPSRIFGHGPRLQVANFGLGRGKPAPPDKPMSDNPAMLSAAGTLHLKMHDWAQFLRVFLKPNNTSKSLLLPDTINKLLTYPDPNNTSQGMAMGWAAAQGLDGVGFGMQGSNLRWAACALLNNDRTQAAFSVCNDGRSRVLMQHPQLTRNLFVPD